MATARETVVLTLAAIRAGAKPTTQYLFNERQRIYTLAGPVADDDASLRLLRSALDDKQPIKAVLDARRGTIQRVAEPTMQEAEEFARTLVPLERPARPVPIDVARIDETIFNLVGIYQKWPSFRLCSRTVPGYARAKEIFDFCARLSCHLRGPYAVMPCITFPYVRDGCFARAHQMRRIITTRYGYCCEKVFSFANQENDELAVRAGKWGGCCVTWWYHVAPLIRVRLKIKGLFRHTLTLAMVIDPGMFDRPVLLSTWLSAQSDSACTPNARVSMYSIQSGSAYQPTIYAGATYSTDPSYALTVDTLIAHRGQTTCP